MLAWGPGTGAVGSGAHPYNLEINSVDWIASLRDGSLSIEMPGPGTNGSMSFRLYDPAVAVSAEPWDEVRFLEHAAARPILFGGFVQSVRYSSQVGITGRWVDIECVGYGILLERRVVPFWGGANNGSYMGYSANQYGGFSGPGHPIQAIVGNYGGRITAQAFGTGPTSYARPDTPMFLGYPDVWEPDTSTSVTFGPGTLRAAIEWWIGLGLDATGDAAGGVFWVDAYCRLWLLPDFATPANAMRAARVVGGHMGIVLDEATTTSVSSIAWEREDADRLTSAYVVGAFDPPEAGVMLDAAVWVTVVPLAEDDDYYVVSSGMVDEDFYTLSNRAIAPLPGGALVSVTHTSVTGTDTLGYVQVWGSDPYGSFQTEQIVPVADGTVYSVGLYNSLAFAGGAGWVVNGGQDTIKIGHSENVLALFNRGYYRTPAGASTGDLVSVATSSSKSDTVTQIGSRAVAATASLEPRGEVVLVSATSIDVQPGHAISADWPSVGLSGSDWWRVTSVRIKWQTLASRTYSINFGGSRAAPSLANRQGRYLTR